MSMIFGIGSRVKHSKFGTGVVIQVWSDCYDVVFMDHGLKQVYHEEGGLEVIDFRSQDPDQVSFARVEKIMAHLLRRFSDIQETVDMAPKWKGGTMVLKPGDSALQGKEIPLETFFHKIVMVRDRLRVMEQRINSSKLDDEDKVHLQQYITRIYGSLTTFNILFSEREDQFIGERSGD
jgi:hypothetical protein